MTTAIKDRTLIIASLKARGLNSFLSILLTALGVGLAVFLIQSGHHIQNRMTADGKGIDIVVGAKGSPLQLVLSSVYHMDIPTGNIPYDAAKKWAGHRDVKTAIPLALGDNWKGFRIVGTTRAYPAHYGAVIADGRLWATPFEAVAGARTGLRNGQEFSGAHGLLESGHSHDHGTYKIVGTLKPTGTVLDRLILTSIDSVLMIHGHEALEERHENHNHDHDHHHHDHAPPKAPEITALLLTAKSPLAAVNLPRTINRESRLQAASPAREITRLTTMLGIGTKGFMALSVILIVIAALGIFSGIAGNLDNRIGDLAVMRAIGYSKARIFRIVAMEGLLLAAAGTIAGLLTGSAGFILAGKTIPSLSAGGAGLHMTASLAALTLAALAAGFLAALFPAWNAAKIDAAKLLSNRV